MKRRDFLGSVIGTVFSLPFLARLDSDEWQRIILPFRMLLKEETSGKWIQATGVAEANFVEEKLQFVMEPLLATAPMVISKVATFTEKGLLIAESKFQYDVSMLDGYMLKAWQTIVLDKSLPLARNIDQAVEIVRLLGVSK